MLTQRGEIRKNNNSEERIKLTRSYIALTDGDGNLRPVFNNTEGHQILKNLRFSRGGQIKLGRFTTTLTYKDVDVRVINTTTGKFTKLNQDTSEGKEFNELVKKLFINTNETIEKISRDTNKPKETVLQMINDKPIYPEFTEEQISKIIEERAKKHITR